MLLQRFLKNNRFTNMFSIFLPLYLDWYGVTLKGLFPPYKYVRLVLNKYDLRYRKVKI